MILHYLFSLTFLFFGFCRYWCFFSLHPPKKLPSDFVDGNVFECGVRKKLINISVVDFKFMHHSILVHILIIYIICVYGILEICATNCYLSISLLLSFYSFCWWLCVFSSHLSLLLKCRQTRINVIGGRKQKHLVFL